MNSHNKVKVNKLVKNQFWVATLPEYGREAPFTHEDPDTLPFQECLYFQGKKKKLAIL